MKINKLGIVAISLGLVGATSAALADTPNANLNIGAQSGQGSFTLAPNYFTVTPHTDGQMDFVIPAHTNCANRANASDCWLYKFHYNMSTPSNPIYKYWEEDVQQGKIIAGVEKLFSHEIDYGNSKYTGCTGYVTGNNSSAPADQQTQANLVIVCPKPTKSL